MLKFTNSNAKLGKLVYILDLSAGKTCITAKECKSCAVIDSNGKRSIEDGKHTEFRCYAASQEVLYKAVYNLREKNTEAVRACKSPQEVYDLFDKSFRKKSKDKGITTDTDVKYLGNIIRLHSSGDWDNKIYFQGVMQWFKDHPDIKGYFYTKRVKMMIQFRNIIPDNVSVTLSYGGFEDSYIEKSGFKYALVVFSEKQAEDMNLEIDHDDSHAAFGKKPFALLLHGTQPKGTVAADALNKLKKKGAKNSYNKDKKDTLSSLIKLRNEQEQLIEV